MALHNGMIFIKSVFSKDKITTNNILLEKDCIKNPIQNIFNGMFCIWQMLLS